MRPLRLELEGFSAFRAPTAVSFEGTDLVAFVGSTGAGKSSLIDALTFALYGSVARYDDRRVVEPAIHKLCHEAKVRLDFELGGVRYTAVRVVRRTKTGATTKEARLFRQDAGAGEEVLAGTERELSDAVGRLLRLDFDQFTKTCVLPQGEFARFLHADKRARQDLLRQILDVGVYQRMGQLARAQADQAGSRSQLLAEQLDRDPPMSDEDLTALEDRAAALQALNEQLPDLLAALAAVDDQAAEVGRLRADLDRAVERLAAVSTVPREVVELAPRVATARGEARAAADALTDARRQRDEARGQKEAGPDVRSLERALAAAERARALQTQIGELTPAAADARGAAATAEAAAEAASKELAEAQDRYDAAKEAAGLSAVIAELVVGEPCPVCRQTVHDLPAHDVDAELAAADAARRELAGQARQTTERARQRGADAAKAEQRLATLVEERAERLAGVPAGSEPDALRAEVAEARRLADIYERTLRDVEHAEGVEASARDALDGLQQQDARLRHDLFAARDQVAGVPELLHRLGGAGGSAGAGGSDGAGTSDGAGVAGVPPPPPIDGRSLADDWEALVAWVGQAHAAVEGARDEATERVHALDTERAGAVEVVVTACEAVGVTVGSPDQAGTAVAAEQGDLKVRLDHAVARSQQAAEMREEIASLDEAGLLSRTMGDLLRADGFERWLLQAALDRLVLRATDRLQELSGGQFSLVSDDGEFLVADHRNADEVRNVRTLSGGETFLTSLALALALADDIAELASEGAPRVESMFLDEGFGTLDPETLDVVAAAIEELSASGRLVGIVTHLRALADRMPVRFEVHKDATTARVERVEV